MTGSWLAGSEGWLRAGWTMLHYAWVGGLLGLLALASRWRLRSASANARYVMALCWLAALAVAPFGIAVSLGPSSASWDGPFVSEVTPESPEPLPGGPSSPRTEPAVGPDAGLLSAGPASSAPSPLSEQTPVKTRSVLWSKMVTLLPWIWILGSALTFAWNVIGLAGAERLRRLSAPASDPRVEALCRRLARSLKISRSVMVAVCRRVASPVLVGVIRPAILVPPALLSGLTPQQLEMVLLHELAHVRRWDNLVNFLQRIVESLLFFHPAVWLVSRWVRQEREHCCDDVVIGRVGDRDSYADMLLAIVRRSTPPRHLGIVATAGAAGAVSAVIRGYLGLRIRRILKEEEQSMQVSPKLVAAVPVTLVAAAVLMSSFGLPRGNAQPASAPGASGESVSEENDAKNDAGETRRQPGYSHIYSDEQKRQTDETVPARVYHYVQAEQQKAGQADEFVELAERSFEPIDLQAKANQKLKEPFGSGIPGNTLAVLSKGEQTFGGVKFQIGEGCVQLASTLAPDRPAKVEGIAVGRSFRRLHILHSTCWGAPGSQGDPMFVEDGTLVGQYQVRYEDNIVETIPIVYGVDLRDWWDWDGGKAAKRAKLAWSGSNDASRQYGRQIRLYHTIWKNPRPDKVVSQIDFVATKASAAAPFCVAMTAEDGQERFEATGEAGSTPAGGAPKAETESSGPPRPDTSDEGGSAGQFEAGEGPSSSLSE